MKTKHVPVLLDELINSLDIQDEDIVVDATLGGGGHAKKVLEKLNGNGVFYGFDLNPKSVESFDNWAKINKREVRLVNSNFANIKDLLQNIIRPSKIYADLGFSTDQLDEFISYKKEGELDLRLDKNLNIKAKDLLNVLYEKELAKLFEDYADIKFAKQLAKQIIKERKKKLFENKSDLVSILEKFIVDFHISDKDSKFVQKVFQALRIAVNEEYGKLEKFLNDSFDILKVNGRIAVIDFHSGEDRIVKKFFMNKVKEGKAQWIEKLTIPSNNEIKRNPKSRSAKMRAIIKLH